ncbi:MAG: hypothetical protein SNI42_07415 [Rikenellaceae bacterium]
MKGLQEELKAQFKELIGVDLEKKQIMKRYEKYKESNVPWLGETPEHWGKERIKHCFNERVEKGFPEEPLLSATQSSGVIPQSLYANRVVTAQKDLHLLKLVEVGDFVISLRSFQGGIEYAYYRGIISPAYTVMTPHSISRGYFRYLAKSKDFIGLLQTCVTGIREGQNIDYKALKNNRLPIPSAEEQAQIVRYLDWKVALADKFVADRRKLIELLKEYRQAEINKAVTKGLNHDAPMRNSGIDWIGDVPAHWVKYSLSQATEEYKCSNKYIQNNNLLSLSYGEVISKDINKTDGLLPASFNNYQVVKHGIIVLRLTDLQNDQKSLRVGLSKKEGILTSAYTYLKCKDYVSPEFTHLLLHSYDIRKVFYGMGGGLRQSLSYQELRKLSLFAPSQAEQQQIAAYLDTISERVKKAIEDIEQQIKLVVEYKTTLISHVVTGKVDVRGIEIQKI